MRRPFVDPEEFALVDDALKWGPDASLLVLLPLLLSPLSLLRPPPPLPPPPQASSLLLLTSPQHASSGLDVRRQHVSMLGVRRLAALALGLFHDLAFPLSPGPVRVRSGSYWKRSVLETKYTIYKIQDTSILETQ